MSGRKVAVTGLGVLSPIGNNVPDSWAAVCAGKNGIGLITLFDASDLHFRIAGEVRGFEDMDALSAKQKKAMGRFAQLGVVAGIQAIADAGLGDSEKDAARIGISVGSGIGGLPEIEATTIKAHNDKRPNAPPRVSPFLIPSVIINIISGHLSIMYNFTGPGVSLVSACTTGAHNIGNAFRMISYGDADVMVCGGAEASITPLAIGSFGSAKALSGCNDTPETPSRPFNRKRDGFVLGEGAGVLVLEEY
ncbi:MAG: beta-ketoacyl synthase N-terminal-like domain-containing protein [Candidatus Zeuxoniibacter abyssi]|nr:MAG: beta-ketoacyl synthase N-terminal-like domain-containing protein [Candidatus Persebacteraceae bacterium AB1(2)]